MSIEQVFNGLGIGVAISLVALALNLSVGVMRILNLAYGEIAMVSALVAAYSVEALNFSPLLAVGLGVLSAVAAGTVVHALAVKPLTWRLNDHPSQQHMVLLSTIGMGFVLQYGAILSLGPQSRSAARVFTQTFVDFSGVRINAFVILNLIALVVLLFGLIALVHRTRFGLRIRAIADNPMLAAVAGVRVWRDEWAVVFLSAAIAGCGGALVVQVGGSVSPLSGALYGFKALVVVLVAGSANFGRTALAGLAMGLLEAAIVKRFGASYRDALVFGLLASFLAVDGRLVLAKRRWQQQFHRLGGK